jgi:adenylate kinase
LVEKYSLVHISTGDVFRANIKNGTPLGKEAESYIKKGSLVPDEITIGMLEAVVEENLATAKGFIFDGFPRTQAQGEALDAFLAKKGLAVSGMLALEVEDEVLVGRLLERGKTSGRADDADESVIRARIAEYYEKTNVLKDFYSAQGKYHGVDGVGSIPEIAGRLSEIVDKL